MRRLLALSLLLLTTTAAAAAELTETIDRTFDVKPGASVVLTNVNGGISVSSWDQPRVRVVATKKARGSKDDAQAALKAIRIDMQPRDGGLVIATKHPRENSGWAEFFEWLAGEHVEADVRYEITVPRSMNLDVENTNGGIRATGVAGKLELATTNGRIEVARCAGSLDASTTNGSIKAELMTVAKGQPLQFETTNGRIEVALPATLALDVDANTTNGSIKSDLPVLTRSTSSNSLRGSINGGGTPLRLRTTNGSISIQRAGA